ncbi:MAG: hypothetical protein ACRETL_17665 [Gammaproteobacteria bacterium]
MASIIWSVRSTTPPEITGYTALAEVSRHTKAPEQRRLARTAIERRLGGSVDNKSPNRGLGVVKNEKYPSDSNEKIDIWRAGQDETANSYVIEIAL